jgi:ribosomal protein S18 acetylase RimI-like enzyme
VKRRHAKRKVKRKAKPKIVLREDERHLKPSGSVLQKNYSILKNDKHVGNVVLDFDLEAYPDQWKLLPVKRTDVGLASIHIDHRQRGKGIGSTVMKKIATVARKHKKRRVVLVVYDWNSKAKKFYEDAGYEKVGEAAYMGKRDKKNRKLAHVMAKKL